MALGHSHMILPPPKIRPTTPYLLLVLLLITTIVGVGSTWDTWGRGDPVARSLRDKYLPRQPQPISSNKVKRQWIRSPSVSILVWGQKCPYRGSFTIANCEMAYTYCTDRLVTVGPVPNRCSPGSWYVVSVKGKFGDCVKDPRGTVAYDNRYCGQGSSGPNTAPPRPPPPPPQPPAPPPDPWWLPGCSCNTY